MRFWLACISCGKRMPFAPSGMKCRCGGTLLVEYDLERAARTMTKSVLRRRVASMWRYAELLPLRHPEHAVSLGEGWTPLVRLRDAERKLPLGKLWIKREEQNPTGSFKARGMSAALSVAKEFGIRKVAVNSNGNAGSALAAYAAFAGMEAHVLLPADCPGLIVRECIGYGAHTVLVDGLIHDGGRIIREGEGEQGWHNVGTLREPGRAEGKKTMGLELAEQLGWKLPDVIVYPTGGGSGIFGMWLAFRQLREMGLVKGGLPRLVSVQEQGCSPLADALQQGVPFPPETSQVLSGPTGLRVPLPPDGPLLAAILRETGGTAVAVEPSEISAAARELGRRGISASPEGAAAWAGLLRLLDQGWIRGDEEVVVFNTSHAMKYWPWPCEGVPKVNNYREWKAALRAAQAGDGGGGTPGNALAKQDGMARQVKSW